MNTGLYSGVSAMRASERRLEAITANLANLNTPAYKRTSAVSQGFTVGSGETAHTAVGTQLRVDFSQGRLERTDNPFDIALLGDGFFAVEGERGEAFTRNGSFHVDDGGVLQTAQGFPVAWDGQRGRIDPVGEQVTIDTAGTVFQGAERVGRLLVVAFDAQELLQQDRQGYYQASPAINRTAADAEVHQFSLERSNVTGVEELVSMISVQRSFESATNLLRMLDQSYRRLNGQS